MTTDVPATTSSQVEPWALDRKTLLLALGLAVVAGVTAYACIVLPRSQGGITPIWLANAWVVAVLLRNRTDQWPLFAGAAFFGLLSANFLAMDASILPASLATCNSMEILVCAWLVRNRCGDDFDISRAGHLAWFVAAAVGASILGACVASSLLGMVDRPDIVRSIAVWFESDALGLLTLTPALLVLTQPSRPPMIWREAWTLGVLAVVTYVIFFVTRYPMLFAISAALTLPTLRMGLPGAIGGLGIIAAFGTVAAFNGHGPMMVTQASDRIVGLQIFLMVSFFTSVPVAVARDAGEEFKTRLRAALAEARTAREAAERAAAVKSEFLANMSHELRTPLTSVVGFTRLAADQPDLSPLSRDYIDRVGDASRALLCAVNDILDFSKLEAGQVTFQPEPVAVAPLLKSALDLFMPQAAAKDLTLGMEDLTPERLTVVIDPDRLRQVLLNLVGNAVKFTGEGLVTLSANYDEAAERLRIAVTDTGAGIADEGLERLFKRFSQVDGSLTRDHGGTGLGLAICKGIIEAMGGEIGATSVVGEGSRFFLSIPAPRTASLAAAPAPSGDLATRTGARVLVTDDHAANRELVKLFLAGVGAEVTEACDGEGAVALAAARPFDVILMDLRMPKLDGIGAVRRIRSTAGLNRATPILAFTADAESMVDGRLEKAGFDGAVAKPVDPGQLIAAIAAAMAQTDAFSELDIDVA